MKFPFLASVIIFIIWFTYESKKARRQSDKEQEDFWIRERRANNTRKQSLDDLEYITIDLDKLPLDIMTDDPEIMEYHSTLEYLSKNPIVNFTGISNTDLKLQYGAPNITLLSRYDQNYTTLVRTLYTWGKKLLEAGYQEEAKTVLEFAVSIRTDIGATYSLLVSIYREQDTPHKIAEMIPIAESLNSATNHAIVRMLQKSCP